MKRQRTQAQIEADAKRTGRPPVSAKEKKQCKVTVRMNEALYKRLSKKAKAAGMELAVYIMRPYEQGKD